MLRRLTQGLHRPAARLAVADSSLHRIWHEACIEADQALASTAQSAGFTAAAARPAPSAAGAASPGPPASGLVNRAFGSAPEFTAAGGSPPQFTAGPDPTRAADSNSGPEFTTAGSSSAQFTAGQSSGPQQDAGAAGFAGGDAWAGDVDAVLERVQEAALSHVKELGWSNAALVAGARDIGVSPAIAGSLEKGGADLVEFFVRRSNAQLAERAASEAESLATLPLQQRLHTLLRWRLEAQQPYTDSWPQALALLASPQAVPTALALLNDLVDIAWHAAGDRSVDLTWYAKRAALASVYSGTELYMLTDYSAEFADTWNVLDRRLRDMVAIGESFSLQL